MHGFWKFDDPQTKQVEQVMFFKNISLAGGALVLFWAFNQLDLPLTVTNSLIDRI
jgi:putative oxidoreductase